MTIDELITVLGFEIRDKDKLDKYQRAIGSVVDELQNMAQKSATAMGAMLTGITLINSETSKMANLADAVGMNVDTANAFSSIANSIGLDTEHIVDLFEEMNNKIGESKAIYNDWLKGGKGEGKELKLVGGFEDALKGLDLSSVDKSFEGLNLEEKVKKIFAMDSNAQYDLFTEAAAVAKDAQVAASSLDILMGGEANKIASALRNHLKEVGLTYDEWKIKKQELNYLDKEGISGAKAYAKQFADTTSIFGSIGKQLSGIAGEYLSPILKSMNDWFRLNKKIVQTNLKEWVANIAYGFERLGNYLKMIWKYWDYIAQSLGGWDVVLPILALIIAFFNPWKALIVGVMLVIDDLFSLFSGGKSVIGDFISYFKSEFPLLSSIIESIGEVFSSVFGLFKSVYDALVLPILKSFKSDGESTSSGIGSSFMNAFSAIGKIVKSVLGIVSTLFKGLTALISGDWEELQRLGGVLFGFLSDGFDGLVDFMGAGAEIIKKSWSAAIDWIMSKVEWVTKKIDSVTKAASDIGGDISDGISSAWDGAVNLFGGDDDKKTSSEKITSIKETITNVKEKIVQSPMVMNMAPIKAPVPTMARVSNQHNNSVKHTHNNSYKINVSSKGESASETADIIKSRIIDTKSIEKATINKIKPIYGAK